MREETEADQVVLAVRHQDGVSELEGELAVGVVQQMSKKPSFGDFKTLFPRVWRPPTCLRPSLLLRRGWPENVPGSQKGQKTTPRTAQDSHRTPRS